MHFIFCISHSATEILVYSKDLFFIQTLYNTFEKLHSFIFIILTLHSILLLLTLETRKKHANI